MTPTIPNLIPHVLLATLLVSCSSTGKRPVHEKETPITKEIDSVKPSKTNPPIPTPYPSTTFIDSTILGNPEALNAIISSHSALNGYRVYTDLEDHALLGDFYGDGVEDLAILIEKQNQVHLCIINYADSVSTYIFEKNGQYDDYSWAGVFKKVPAGDTLWSNYEDDFRGFDEVPEDEKVVLPYDAILAHALESCGGGFIFWKDGQFNWLQQE